MEATYCEGCGCFMSAEAEEAQKCEECFENELIDAVENNVWPNGMTFSVWQDIRQKYSVPDVRE